MASSIRCLAIVVLAVLATAAAAQDCNATRQAWAANLAGVSPKGCLKQVLNATQTQDIVTSDCFNKLNLNLTNNTGAAGCPTRAFTVAFDDQKKCASGMDTIADGTLNATTKAGEFDAGGSFITGTNFKGSLNSKNEFKVTADGAKCELTYALKPVGKAVALSAAEAKAAATKNATSAADASAAPSPAGAPAPKKSGAATSTASVLLVALCAVLAFLL